MNCLEAGTPGVPAAMSDVPGVVYPLGRWTLLKNPFVKRSKPVAPVPPVQGELLLDSVRPIRNDLSDSDLEIVRATAPAGTAVSPALQELAPAPSVPSTQVLSGTLTPPVAPSNGGPEATPDAGVGLGAVGLGGFPIESRREPAAWDRVREQLFGTGKS